MASHFLVKLNFNIIENEQGSVILVNVKKISLPWEENTKPSCYWFFDLLCFIRISLSTPNIMYTRPLQDIFNRKETKTWSPWATHNPKNIIKTLGG